MLVSNAPKGIPSQDYNKMVRKFGEAILAVQGLGDESYLRQGEHYLIIDRKPGAERGSIFGQAMRDAAREVGLFPLTFTLSSEQAYQSFPQEMFETMEGGIRAGAGFFDYSQTPELRGGELPARIELLKQRIENIEYSHMHSPGITLDMAIKGAIQCNYQTLKEQSQRMLQLMEGAVKYHVTAPGGTDIKFEIPSRIKFDTDCVIVPPNVYGKKGKFGNFPFGEIWAERMREVAVKDGDSGRVVTKAYPWKIKGTGVVFCDVCTGSTGPINRRYPLWVEFKDGVVTGYGCEDPMHEGVFHRWKESEGRFGKKIIMNEVGIGFNRKAKNKENMLEAEKMGGTIHIAPGGIDNHEDLLFNKPTMKVWYRGESIPQTIMERGRVIMS